jgi:hypothetical protein
VRSHLAYGLTCGIIGDAKYGWFGEGRAVRPVPVPMQRALSLMANQSRKLPFYLHLNQASEIAKFILNELSRKYFIKI